MIAFPRDGHYAAKRSLNFSKWAIWELSNFKRASREFSLAIICSNRTRESIAIAIMLANWLIASRASGLKSINFDLWVRGCCGEILANQNKSRRCRSSGAWSCVENNRGVPKSVPKIWSSRPWPQPPIGTDCITSLFSGLLFLVGFPIVHRKPLVNVWGEKLPTAQRRTHRSKRSRIGAVPAVGSSGNTGLRSWPWVID